MVISGLEKRKVILYGNGGSGNHGCEAIVRGTIELLGSGTIEYIIHSIAPEQDNKYGLNNLAQIKKAYSERKRNFRFILAYIKMKLTGDYTEMDGLYYLPMILETSSNKGVAFSVGGDNYCYGGTGLYGYLNKAYRRSGLQTVLWGCSIEPKIVANPKVAADLQKYSIVFARESITYNAVKAVNHNTILFPDPAFFMPAQVCKDDKKFFGRDVIGINISPMIIANEQSSGITYRNYKKLIQYILNTTDANIALIPHVVWENNDDRIVLKKLQDDIGQNSRLILIEDHTAPELKYIISKCRLFVGARTHATIAAYSTCVPTLVVGYSVKARGIARDLFGTEENYVLPVQSLRQNDDLTKAFQWLLGHEDEVRNYLKEFIPEYCQQAYSAVQKMKDLVGV